MLLSRKTWDAYYDFFNEVQKSLRKQGVRNTYGLGLNVTTNGVDPNNVFQFEGIQPHQFAATIAVRVGD